MHCKDYWNFITHNDSVWRHHVHSVAAVLVLYSVISVSYFDYLMMASETPRIYAIFGWNIHLELKNCYHSFAKDTILTNIRLKKCWRSDGVNYNTSKISSFYFSYHLKYVFFNLVTAFMWNINKPSVNTNFTQIWLIRINKNMYDQC